MSMDTEKIRALASGARDELAEELSARLDEVLAEGSRERLERPADVAALERAVRERGRGAVVEQAAYTWFNRLAALRFMDARGFTPVGVVTPRPGSTVPALLADAARGAADPSLVPQGARERAWALLSGAEPSEEPSEEAYARLLEGVCGTLEGPMPYLFSPGLASALLMPRGLLAPGSVLRRVVAALDDGACGGVEVLGWLYQFYVERDHRGFYASGRRAGPADLAPATQLFTPEWIVRYLVQNTLGRLWMRMRPDSALASEMEYYVPPEEDEGDGGEGLPEGPEDIRLLDPACGSGHILVYAYRLLFQMYEEEGWLPEEIPSQILGNNLSGLEIDQRAAEIALFSLDMCALEDDPGFLSKGVHADIAVLVPAGFEEGELEALGEGAQALAGREGLLDELAHLGEAGSLVVVDGGDLAAVDAALAAARSQAGLAAGAAAGKLGRMQACACALSRTFDVVVANPPYLGSGRMGPWLSGWVKKVYPDEKGDLCTCFVARGLEFAKEGGYVGMVTMQSWMFLGSFEKMRKKLLGAARIAEMAHLGAHAFDAIGGEVVQTTAFVLESGRPGGEGDFIRVVDEPDAASKEAALLEAVRDPSCRWRYRADPARFARVPGSPIAYWASDAVLSAFDRGVPLGEVAEPKVGLQTSDNARFLRTWWEVPYEDIGFGMASRDEARASGLKWFPCDKGGSYRKWYGNEEFIINWRNDGKEMKAFPNAVIRNPDYYFKPYVSWTNVSSGQVAFRFKPSGQVIEHCSDGLFVDEQTSTELLGFGNSSAAMEMLTFLAPTLHFEVGQIAKLPVLDPAPADAARIDGLVQDNIALSKADWDSCETSWDFERHPLCRPGEPLVENQMRRWQQECGDRFERLRANEEELNAIFASLYGMEGEVEVGVPDGKVSVHRVFERDEDVPEGMRGGGYARTFRDEAASLVSYGVGCLMGRYSADAPGLVLAGAGQGLEDFDAKVPGARFRPDADGVLPVTSRQWFGDDAASGLLRWLAAAYGEDALGDNVAFLERCLGMPLRDYLCKGFYKDHCAAYQATSSGKRPIYWMFESPKKTFRALVYVHRWTPSTLGRLSAAYVRPMAASLRAEAASLSSSPRKADRAQAERSLAQARELEDWDREVLRPLADQRIALDLDDGVRANYAKLPGALAKI